MESKLFYACDDANWEEAARLIDEKTGLGYVDQFRLTVLHKAILALAPLAIIQELIKQGLDVNAKNIWQGNSLHLAVAANADFRVVQLLIAKGARADEQDVDGETPLMLAARQNKRSQEGLMVVRNLTSGKVNPNLVNKNETAMQILAKRPHARREFMWLLIKKGGLLADELIELANLKGNTQMAKELKQMQILLLLCSTQSVPRLRRPKCKVQLIPTDLLRQVRETLFESVPSAT